MRFLNKNHVNPCSVIIYVSFIVFLLRLYACRYVFPEFTGMDYYGYVELGKNIFHRLDFTVRWELDSPIQYPPFFPILIYLFTCLTKNPVVSILWINIFSASFYLIPLFCLVRNILNTYFAVLAVIFTTYYFGIQPCYLLNMDFFYSFLVIIICWLMWDTLTHRSHQAGRYVLAGVLISLAYLTKYSGMLFCWAGVGSILYYFARHQHNIKTGFKFCAFLILGASPLFITYHLLLYNHSKRDIPSISAYAFFDGNYMYEKGLDYREEKIAELNSEGTEFAYVSLLKTNNEFNFSLREPLFVLDKYMWGLNKMSQEITFNVLPGGGVIAKSKFYNMSPDGGKVFMALMGNGYTGILREASVTEVRINPDYYLTADAVRKAAGVDFDKVWDILKQSLRSRTSINFMFQWTFLLLLIISGIYFKWHFNIMHVLFFAIGMMFIPFYFIAERYLMPFMPLYFVLWFFILNAGYCLITKAVKDKILLVGLSMAVFVFLVFMYSTNTYKQIYQHCRYYMYDAQRNRMRVQTALWIKQDSMGLAQRAKIMSCHDNYLSYLTDSDYIRPPYVIVNWDKVINFAALKKVNYIVIEDGQAQSFLAFFNTHTGFERIKMIHEIKGSDNTVLVLKI